MDCLGSSVVLDAQLWLVVVLEIWKIKFLMQWEMELQPSKKFRKKNLVKKIMRINQLELSKLKWILNLKLLIILNILKIFSLVIFLRLLTSKFQTKEFPNNINNHNLRHINLSNKLSVNQLQSNKIFFLNLQTKEWDSQNKDLSKISLNKISSFVSIYCARTQQESSINYVTYQQYSHKSLAIARNWLKKFVVK